MPTARYTKEGRKMPRQNKPSMAKYSWALTWGKWLVYVLIFVLFLVKALNTLDPDFGWHLREGQDFLNGIFPAHDIYNFNAADYSWAAHEWLSDVFMAVLYSIGGYPLVAVVWGLIFTAGFWLVGQKKFGPAVFAAFLACIPFIGVRTVVFSVFGLGFLMWFMGRKFKNSKIQFVLIPVILLFWAQLHGSFTIGIIYLIYRAVFVDKSWKVAVATVIGGLATIINPFGYHLWLETLSILTDGKLMWNINEWAFGIDFWTITPLFMLWVLNFILNPPKKLLPPPRRTKNWLYFAKFDIFLFITSVKSIRNYPLFALSAINPAHNSLAKIHGMSRTTKQGIVFARIIYIGFILGLLFVTIYQFTPTIKQMIDNHQIVNATSGDNGMPNEIVNYINDKPCAGNMFNHYNIGGYFIWKLPNQKVYMDGRMGTTWSRPADSALGEPGENYYETWALINGGERTKPINIWFTENDESDGYEYTARAAETQARVFEKFNITCAVTEAESKLSNHLKNSGSWHEAIADDIGWTLLVKDI